MFEIHKYIFLEYEPLFTYEEFIEKKVYEIFSLDKNNITLSDSKWRQIEEELLIDYQAYNAIFDLDYKILNDYKIQVKTKNYLKILILNQFLWFEFNIWELRKVYKLLWYNLSDVFYTGKYNMDWKICINMIKKWLNWNDLSYKWIIKWLVDYIKYKKIKDDRDKKMFKDSFNEISKMYDKDFLKQFSKNIRYKEEFNKNYIIEYILFSIVFLQENLYFCSYKNNDFFIVNQDCLNKVIDYPVLIFNINKIFKPLVEKYDIDEIQPYKKRLWIKNKKFNINTALNEIEKQYKLFWNISIIAASKEMNLDRRSEINSQLPNNDIWFKVYKWKKQYIKTERKITLKNKRK